MAELVLAPRRVQAHREATVSHGVVGGALAGIVSTLVLMVIMAITGDGFFRPLELVGSIWYAGIVTGVGVSIAGAATILVASIALGLLFSYLMRYVTIDPVFSGLVYSAVAWLALGLAINDSLWDGYNSGLLLIAFLSFGLVLGLFEEYADRARARRDAAGRMSDR